MKHILFRVVLLFFYYKTGYCTVYIVPIKYDEGSRHLNVNERTDVICKSTQEFDTLEWVRPDGEIIGKDSSKRIYVRRISSSRGLSTLFLTFTRNTLEDTGIWKCRSHSGSSDVVPICILGLAEFFDTPSEVVADIGRSITLSCQAKGIPEPNFMWYKSGAVINDVVREDSFKLPKYRIRKQYSNRGLQSTLTIMGLTRKDSGVYVCTVAQLENEKSCGNFVQSHNITLQVNYAPEFDKDVEDFYYTSSNDSAYLFCNANSYPKPTYRWFEEQSDGIVIAFPQNDIEVVDDWSSLKLSVSPNATIYLRKILCRATNIYGEKQKLFIVNPPTIVKPVKVSVHRLNENDAQIQIIWTEDDNFPVTGFKIQLLEVQIQMVNKLGLPKEEDWKKADEIFEPVKFERSTDSNEKVIFITVPNMPEYVKYWMRLRTVNKHTMSPWSDTISSWAFAEKVVDHSTESQIINATSFYGSIMLVVVLACVVLYRITVEIKS